MKFIMLVFRIDNTFKKKMQDLNENDIPSIIEEVKDIPAIQDSKVIQNDNIIENTQNNQDVIAENNDKKVTRSCILKVNDFILNQWEHIGSFLYGCDIFSRFSGLYYGILFLSYIIFDFELRSDQLLMMLFCLFISRKLETLCLHWGENEKLFISKLSKDVILEENMNNQELYSFFIYYEMILKKSIFIENLYQTKKGESFKIIINSFINDLKVQLQKTIIKKFF